MDKEQNSQFSQAQPPTQQQQTQTKPYHQSYVSNLNVWERLRRKGTTPSLLEWSADGMIRLYAIDKKTNQVTGTVFESAPSEITNVRQAAGMLYLMVDKKNYTLHFSSSATVLAAMGGAASLAASSKVSEQAGVDWWVDNLKAAGAVKNKIEFNAANVIQVIAIILLSLLFIGLFA